MQVSTPSIVCMSISAEFGLLFPIVLLIVLRKRLKISVVPFFVGCLTFFLSAMVLESLMHQLVLRSAIGAVIQGNVWLYALYGGLAAGVFEETGRLCAMKLMDKKHPNPRTALMYGAGHGCIEIVMVLGMGMVSNVAMAMMINSGGMEEVLAQLTGEELEMATANIQTLATTPAPTFLVGIAERIIALVLHVGLSVLVWQSIQYLSQRYLFFAAIGLHALVDFLAVVLQGYGAPIWAIEIILALCTLGIGWYAWNLYEDEEIFD